MEKCLIKKNFFVLIFYFDHKYILSHIYPNKHVFPAIYKAKVLETYSMWKKKLSVQ